jgi:C1A family cysteine protease
MVKNHSYVTQASMPQGATHETFSLSSDKITALTPQHAVARCATHKAVAQQETTSLDTSHAKLRDAGNTLTNMPAAEQHSNKRS